MASNITYKISFYHSENITVNLIHYKKWNIIFYVLAFMAALFVVLLVAFYIHAGFIVGHLPIASLNDPKNFSIYRLYAPFIWTSAALLTVLFPSGLVLLPVYFISKRKPILWKPICLFVSAYGLAFAMLFTDIFVWFLD